MTDAEKIADLERRVRELEARLAPPDWQHNGYRWVWAPLPPAALETPWTEPQVFYR